MGKPTRYGAGSEISAVRRGNLREIKSLARPTARQPKKQKRNTQGTRANSLPPTTVRRLDQEGRRPPSRPGRIHRKTPAISWRRPQSNTDAGRLGPVAYRAAFPPSRHAQQWGKRGP